MAGKEVEDEFTKMVPGAAGRGPKFLVVVAQTCADKGIALQFEPAARGNAGGTAIKAPLGSGLNLEVFAKDQGPHLQVGWEIATVLVGGAFLGKRGLFAEINTVRTWGQRNPDKMRDAQGMFEMFRDYVFLETLQQLADAVAAERPGQGRNGFLGA
jgi:hypothetical protein